MLQQLRSTSRTFAGRGRGAAARAAAQRGMADTRRAAAPPFADRLREWEREWDVFLARPNAAGLGTGTARFEGEDRTVELGVTRPIDLLASTDSARSHGPPGATFLYVCPACAPKAVRDASLPPVVAVLDGEELWDLTRPLERSCTVQVRASKNPPGTHLVLAVGRGVTRYRRSAHRHPTRPA